jgi:hypothetical protein
MSKLILALIALVSGCAHGVRAPEVCPPPAPAVVAPVVEDLGPALAGARGEVERLTGELVLLRRQLETTGDEEVMGAAALGFGEDHADMGTACEVETRRVVPDDETLRKVITRRCRLRSHHSSRGDSYRSKIDGTKIHDRDRPAAWRFVRGGKRVGWLRETCPVHRINKGIQHPHEESLLVMAWPYKPPLRPETERQWRLHPHDMERLGTRGPIDMNPAYQSRFFGTGCVDPEIFDRLDVSASAHARRAVWVCRTKVDGPCTSKALWRAWRPGRK